MKEKIKKSKVIIIMAILLLGCLLYVGNDYKNKTLLKVFQSGSNQTILQIINLSKDCKPVTLQGGGIALQLIDVNCK